MSGALRRTAVILAALGILGSIIGNLWRENTIPISDNNTSYVIAEEIIPPRGNRG